MPKTRPPYPEEYRRRIVELHAAGRSIESLAREFEPTATTISNWIKQAQLDAGEREDGLTTEEQQELAAHFQIRSIPTLMIFREKIIIFSQPGALPGSALDQLIEQASNLDMDQVRKEIEQQQQSQA